MMQPPPQPDHRQPDHRQPEHRQPEHEDREHETPVVERTGVLADDPTAPPTVAEQRWHALARLMAVESPTLAPLVRMSPMPDGVTLTHRLPVDSVTLAALRAASPLRAGHVLTVALAVAEALADLDERDLAHGGVSADQVVVGPDGSVVLAGCGLAWRRPPGDVDGPRAVDDVAALGELVRDLLGAGSSPSALVLAALRAADADPALRPTALELSAMLRRCGRADPLLDLLWGGASQAQRTAVTVEPADGGGGPSVGASVGIPGVGPRSAEAPRPLPAALSRLRIDPRTAPGPGVEVDRGDNRREPGDRPVRAEASTRPSAPRRPGAPRRSATRDRRTPRRRGGPWVIVLVSVLAALALGAVRVGARAMADGPAGAAVGVAETPVATTSGLPTGAAAATATEAAAATATGAAADPAATSTTSTANAVPSGSAAAEAGSPVDLDRGAASTAPDWTALLAAADAGRQSALSAGDATALATWVDPEGSAWAADAALAARVTALGARIDGGALVVLDVRPRHVTASAAVLLVQDRRDAYTVSTVTGTSSVPARAPRWWQVTLRRTTDSDGAVVWRLRDVAPAAAPTG